MLGRGYNSADFNLLFKVRKRKEQSRVSDERIIMLKHYVILRNGIATQLED